MSTSTLQEVIGTRRGLVGVVSRLSERFGTVSRRGFFVSAAVAGSALVTDPRAYALRPQTAYATICGPGNTAASGWTVFCATINKGVNACPSGSFSAGWWKAAGSSWCGGGYRYIVDCNASCSNCSTGCSGDHICDKGCWNCSCGSGSKATCDQRRVCCNAFRYGQCNTQVKCSGGVHCRVVSCVPPYKWTNCTTTSLRDDRTREHSAPSLPKWGAIERRYRDLGAQRSFLRASTGPERAVGDGRGRYVTYQGGVIYWTSRTGPRAVTNAVRARYRDVDGPRGVLRYPTSDQVNGLLDKGWIQHFENGAVTDSSHSTIQVVHGAMYRAWVSSGRERGPLGYPTTGQQPSDRGTHQNFQNGELWALGSGTPRRVYGAVLSEWKDSGGVEGPYGYPVGDTVASDGGLTCDFEGGTITA